MEGATTTLADSLLDDLDDLDDLEEEEEEEEEERDNQQQDQQPPQQYDQQQEEQQQFHHKKNLSKTNTENDSTIKKTTSTRKRLLNNPNLLSCLSQIETKLNLNQNHHHNHHPQPPQPQIQIQQYQNQEEQHHFIQKCNRYLSALNDEMHTAHLELIQAYAPKFPELADLIVHPMQYKNTVQVLMNESDLTSSTVGMGSSNSNNSGGGSGGSGSSSNTSKLSSILNSNQILTISVAATTTSASTSQLSPTQLQTVQNCCHYMDQVQEFISTFSSYVQSQMSDLIPNTSILIGPTIASQLLGLAGGLSELSKIPACNLQVLGQTKHNSTSRAGMSSIGMSLHSKVQSSSLSSSSVSSSTTANAMETTYDNTTTATLQPHTGILFNCDLVQKCPSYLQKKALKTVASKLALAIRCDYVNVESGRKRTNVNGLKFRSDIEAKIQKWEEPEKARVLKALPKPDLTTKKRRGGKRMRRLKERFEETELMKQANQRAFSTKVGEYGDDAMGLTLGMLDTKDATGGGSNIKNLANLQSQAKKMRVANTKASRQSQNKRRAIQMSSGGSNGLTSSMVFTPVQGLELVNPDAQRERVRQANAKWFSENTGFQSALPKKK